MKQIKELGELVKEAVADALLRLPPRDRTYIERAIMALQHAGAVQSNKLGPGGATMALAAAGLWSAQQTTFAQEWLKWNKAP